MTEVRHTIDPEPVRAELKNAAFVFLFDKRQPKRVAIKSNCGLISMARALDRDVRAAGKFWAVNVGKHPATIACRGFFSPTSSLFWSPASCHPSRCSRW